MTEKIKGQTVFLSLCPPVFLTLFHRLFATRTNRNKLILMEIVTDMQRNICALTFIKDISGKRPSRVRFPSLNKGRCDQKSAMPCVTCHVWKDTSHCSGEPVWLRVPQQPHNARSAAVPGKTLLWKACNRTRDSSLPVWVAMDTIEEKQNHLRRKIKDSFPPIVTDTPRG